MYFCCIDFVSYYFAQELDIHLEQHQDPKPDPEFKYDLDAELNREQIYLLYLDLLIID